MKTFLSFFRPADTRRKIYYVDESLQKFFLVGLVLMEVALSVSLIWLMRLYLDEIVSDNLYRAHLADAESILNQMALEALFLLGLFFVVNLIALLLVDWVWRRYVGSIVGAFMQLVKKTDALDYSADPQFTKRHQVLDLAERHREQARQTLATFRTRLAALPGALQQPDNPQAVAQLLHELRALLPPTP
jgi:hypothetical protein